MDIDIKLIFAVLSTVITIVAYYPYIRDIFLKKTKPHSYTWLIWAITQGVATAGIWDGGGKWGVVSVFASTLLVIVVLVLSLRFGTRNIRMIDTFVLALALLAIVVWLKLGNPLLAVLMASAIDGLGYIPTYRKSFVDPWSETVLFWICMVAAGVLGIFANAEYNFLTVTYLATLVVANSALL